MCNTQGKGIIWRVYMTYFLLGALKSSGFALFSIGEKKSIVKPLFSCLPGITIDFPVLSHSCWIWILGGLYLQLGPSAQSIWVKLEWWKSKCWYKIFLRVFDLNEPTDLLVFGH